MYSHQQKTGLSSRLPTQPKLFLYSKHTNLKVKLINVLQTFIPKGSRAAAQEPLMELELPFSRWF